MHPARMRHRLWQAKCERENIARPYDVVACRLRSRAMADADANQSSRTISYAACGGIIPRSVISAVI